MNELRNVSSSPHIRAQESSADLMRWVLIALMPTTLFGIWHYGLKALLLILVSVFTCVTAEYLYEKGMRKPVTVSDCSAAVTGLLLALNLPAGTPWWMAVLGGAFAIIVVKQLFGGLGQNFMNPALAARCFLLISFAGRMTNFTFDAVSGATPLASMRAGESVDLIPMLIGMTPGTIGETSAAAILIGAVILLAKKVISIRIPGTYLLTFVIFMTLFGGRGLDPSYLAGQLLGGGLMLCAWFMATDYVTSPITPAGQIVYGVCLGVLTGVFRCFGAAVEGVSYAVILGNLLVPLIERVTIPTAFGISKTRKGGAS